MNTDSPCSSCSAPRKGGFAAGLEQADPAVWEAVGRERRRQQEGLEMIASENFTSPAVMQAQGSVMTNKYAEGYPGRRYYGGCEYVDVVERLAIERAKDLFGAEAANVQPHSGTQANTAVYLAVLKPGDRIMGMKLDQGGHLTHGHPLSLSGRYYEVVSYGVCRDSEVIDMDEVRDLALKHRPRLIIAGASAYPRTIDFAAFAAIAREADARLMVDMAHIAGLVAAGEHPSPVPHAPFVTTTTHKTLRGPRGGLVLCRKQYTADINRAVFPGLQGGPLMHVIAAKAVCLGQAATPEFRQYQHQVVVNAAVLGRSLQAAGLRLVSGGTDNHLLLVDTGALDITGKDAEEVLGCVGITVNKNAIPFDPRPPAVTSGIRVGTPALTTRGMREAEMEEVGGLIAGALRGRDSESALDAVRRRVAELAAAFPLPY